MTNNNNIYLNAIKSIAVTVTDQYWLSRVERIRNRQVKKRFAFFLFKLTSNLWDNDNTSELKYTEAQVQELMKHVSFSWAYACVYFTSMLIYAYLTSGNLLQKYFFSCSLNNFPQ